MTLKYTLFRKPGNVLELEDKIESKGIERKVAFNILTQDKLNYVWPFYWTNKDSVKTDYCVIVSSIEDPRVFLKKHLGTILWGIQLPWTPQDERIIERIRGNYQKIKQDVENSGLEVVQEYVPKQISG